MTFLNPSQQLDFQRHHSFFLLGGQTRDRYMISHRHSWRASTFFIVHNLTSHKPICVHKSQLPPAEEMLALLFVLGSQREKWWLREGGHLGRDGRAW
jgi:hypothetical protein